VITEREMRAADCPLGAPPREQPRFALPLGNGRGQLQLTPAGAPRPHFPDCAVAAGDDSVLAIELERTAKARVRLRAILSAYVAARHVAAVRYYVVGSRVRALVESEVETAKARELITVCADDGPPDEPVRLGDERERGPRRTLTLVDLSR